MTAGAACALNVILKSIINPYDEVIVFAPYFSEYNNYIRNYDGEIKVVSTNKDTFMPNLEELREKINVNTKAIIINTPNNTFYKIINITKEEYYVICEEMMVAGSGGGGWQGLRLNEVTAFPRIVAYNKDPIVGVYIPVASDGRTGTCDIEVNIYREKNAV